MRDDPTGAGARPSGVPRTAAPPGSGRDQASRQGPESTVSVSDGASAATGPSTESGIA